VFAELARRFDFRLLLVGPREFACPGVRVELRGWRSYASRAEEAADLADFDIGVMPLSDDPFAAGKCGLKAIQYMASGIPVVASPVGANREVVADGACGFLADSPEEWRARLSELLADPDLRERMGRAGRRRAVARYSLRSAVPELVRLLQSAAEPPEPGCERVRTAAPVPGISRIASDSISSRSSA
jgi:glycosyltransferase involved in cell wall biosynthesis